eukprot:scaffold31112_cov62-Isochrysis_galbana.AAC.1
MLRDGGGRRNITFAGMGGVEWSSSGAVRVWFLEGDGGVRLFLSEKGGCFCPHQPVAMATSPFYSWREMGEAICVLTSLRRWRRGRSIPGGRAEMRLFLSSPVCGDGDVGVDVAACAHQGAGVAHEDGVGVAGPDVVPECQELAVETNL